MSLKSRSQTPILIKNTCSKLNICVHLSSKFEILLKKKTCTYWFPRQNILCLVAQQTPLVPVFNRDDHRNIKSWWWGCEKITITCTNCLRERSHEGCLSFTIGLVWRPHESPSSLWKSDLSLWHWYILHSESIEFLNTLHLYLGNQVGSLLSRAESILSTGTLSKLSSSSVAELKLQAKMVGERRKERKNTLWIKHPILILLLLVRLCCYLVLVRCLIRNLLFIKIKSGLK